MAACHSRTAPCTRLQAQNLVQPILGIFGPVLGFFGLLPKMVGFLAQSHFLLLCGFRHLAAALGHLILPERQAAAGAEHQGEQRQHRGRRRRRPSSGPDPAALQRPDRPGLHRLARQEAAQVLRQFQGGGVAPGRLLVQALQADRFQVARHGRIQGPHRHGLLVQHLRQGLHFRRATEGSTPGEALVQDGAQRVHVRSRTHFVHASRGLFWGHVRRRTHNGAGLRSAVVAVQPLGQAEVGNLGRTESWT